MPISRRNFLLTTAAATLAASVPSLADSPQTLGHGDHKYRVVPNWGILGPDTPVNNCHGLVADHEGHIILLTDHVKNNVIIYDKAGKLIHKWGTIFPGAHGLSIVDEPTRQVLFVTDLKTHKVYKSTLDGQILNEISYPKDSGKYDKEDDYRPSWTLHFPDGSFFILDGYGKDYITRHDADGKRLSIFGGQEGGIKHWGPHGGMADLNDAKDPTLLIAMSDQQHLLRLSPEGKKLAEYPLPGGNPRQIRQRKELFYVAHLGDKWPKDQNCRGFVSILDRNLRVLSNLAGTPPIYNEAGELQPMKHQEEIFLHPHDLTIDDDGSIYVGQFASNQTYPIKLERI